MAALDSAAETRPADLLLPVLRRARRPVAAALALALASAAASLLVPYVVSAMVEAIGTRHAPVRQGAALAVLMVAGAFASGWSSYLLGRVGEYGVAGIRDRMVRHMLAMRPAEVRARGAGDLIARTTADAAQVRSVSDATVTVMPVSALLVLASLVLMGCLDWVLLLIVIGTFALAGLAIRAFLRGMRRSAQSRQEALGVLADRLSATLAALPTIKACRAEERMGDPIREQVSAVARSAVAADRAQAFISPLMGLGQQIAIVGVLAVGGARVASGQLSPAHYVAFLMYLFQMVNPLMTVSSGFARVQLGLASVGRILDVLAEPTERSGPDAEPARVPGGPAIEFRGVHAGYQDQDVLHGVDLAVPARGITAIVGRSGAGKSTVLNLIECFLEPRAGHVALHGADLAAWPLAAARGRIAYLDQSNTVVDGTIRDNVVLGCRAAPSDEAVLAALRRVGLAEAVEALPEGLDTRMGRAKDFSGGQRQRLALVRALLADADVLLLDEPSSQLDGPNEERLLAILGEAARERAVVVVTHRLSTIRDAGRIIYLDDGRVVDAGAHEDLLERCPGYRALVRSQSVPADLPDPGGEPVLAASR